MVNVGFHESLEIEFKRDIGSTLGDDDLVEVVVSLANTNGGDLYIGVEDNGDVSGLREEHRRSDGLATVIANKTLPPHTVRVEHIDGPIPYVIVHVPKCRWGYISTTSGKYLKRRIKFDGTPEMVAISPNEFPSRLSNLGMLDYSMQEIPSLSYEDLDKNERDRLRTVIKKYHTRGDVSLLELSDEELDKALHFIKEVDGKYVPTVTGLLILGKEDKIRDILPTAVITIQVLKGTDIAVNEEFTYPLLKAVEIIEQYVQPWNPESEIQSGLFRVSIPLFDKRAFREALVNALVHRDYTILGRVRILIDDDGLTISNPGGFVEGVTLDNLLTVDPRARNQCLADALKRIGLAEKTGRGIDRIYEGALVYGRPWPDYSESDSTTVKLFIQRADPDEAFTAMILEEKNKLGRELPLNSLLVLSALKEERRADTKRIAEMVHLSAVKTKSALEHLVESGLVEARGDGRGRIYLLSSKVYKKTASMAEYVRQRDIDKIRYVQMVLQFVEANGYITRKDVIELFHISNNRAYLLLKSMVESGDLQMVGTRKAARYFSIRN